MPDSNSDTSGLTPQERELVERIRAQREEALRRDPDAADGLRPDKQHFPIGIRPDGTVNRVE